MYFFHSLECICCNLPVVWWKLYEMELWLQLTSGWGGNGLYSIVSLLHFFEYFNCISFTLLNVFVRIWWELCEMELWLQLSSGWGGNKGRHSQIGFSDSLIKIFDIQGEPENGNFQGQWLDSVHIIWQRINPVGHLLGDIGQGYKASLFPIQKHCKSAKLP